MGVYFEIRCMDPMETREPNKGSCGSWDVSDCYYVTL